MTLDKFLPPFIDFIDEHFGRENHHYVFINNKEFQYGLTTEYNVEFLNTDDEIFITLLEYMKRAEKIILHGLWRDRVNSLLYFNQKLLKKCYWVMWGGDFYFPKTQSWAKKQIIKKMGYLVTGNRGDYKLAKKWYKAKGKQIDSFIYPSNLYKKYDQQSKKHETINIQVGNSADPTNNHLEAFTKLIRYKDEDIKIYTPLSYGNKEYANEIIFKGNELFGEKFIPLTEFISFEKYIELLSEIDIAIFLHNRQQAMGNTITLLGLGKKVYMRNDVTTWKLFNDIGVKIFDQNDINLSQLAEEEAKSNIEKIKKHYSKNILIKSLEQLLLKTRKGKIK